MTEWVDIIDYRDFWDVPRIFFVRHDGQLLLFDCPFDEEIEDHPDTYHVYLMPELAPNDLAGSWAHLSQRAIRLLGVIPIQDVAFDPTHRRQIDGSVLASVLPPPVRTLG